MRYCRYISICSYHESWEGQVIQIKVGGSLNKATNLYVPPKDNIESIESIDGDQSRWFSASQGVHQDAGTSMILYTMFINSRLVELREARFGCYIGETHVGSP